ncbi:MAG: hypothetical protein H6576_07740 [Lewinellaceae bacterium]|nr:hypothetical protein [Saprospiraceae bacterium]MCB9343572.1 hypothetical protein [Lewinellaceae bacterium]
MLFATLNGVKVEANPKAQGTCLLCDQPVFPKCGEINVWHWAHYKDKNCDYWYEPETEWHKNWKLVFGKENCEIVISKDGCKHIADVLTNDDLIIELQNSPIQIDVIREREDFYGERMLWIINGKHFKNNFSIFKSRLDEDIKYFRFYDPLSAEFGKVDNSPKNEFNFTWSWCRKSWSNVQRNVFIDFGDEYLFWVKEGMGTNSGKGNQVMKKFFLNKYGGDLELLATLIDGSKDTIKRLKTYEK